MRLPLLSRAVWRGLTLALPLTLAAVTLACRDESLGPPVANPSTAYWDLQLDHHAVMLSTAERYRTLPLAATPRNIRQEPIAGLPAPTYVSENPERVLVTSDGELVAVAPTAPGTHVKVVATLTAENLKHTDYVLVQVVDNPTPPVLGSLSVQPLPPDSAKVAVAPAGQPPVAHRLPLRAFDTQGTPMTDLLVAFRSSDPRIALINDTSGVVAGLVPGWVTLYAVTTAFGITKADTLRFRIGLPLLFAGFIQARRDGTPGSFLEAPELKVGLNAVVMWQGSSADATRDLDITFTDPAHVAAITTSPLYSHPIVAIWAQFCEFITSADCAGSGSFVLRSSDVPNTNPPQRILGFALRTFPVAGTYSYHSTLQGFTGRIVVVDEREE